MSLPTQIPDLEKGPVDDRDSEQALEAVKSESNSNLPVNPPTILSMFGPNDPEDPHNFPVWRKLLHSFTLVSMCFTCAMSSAMFTPALVDIEGKYHVTREVGLLGTAMVLIGYTTGPILWSAVNEAYGRWYAWQIGFLGFILFQIPTGVNPNFQTLLIGRFFQGFFGVSTLVTFGGSMSDIWGFTTRSYAAAAAVFAIFAAPSIGPVIGSFFVKWANFGWISWLIMIMGGVLLTLNLFVTETAPPVLLRRKAIRLRKEGQNVRAALEEVPPTLRNLTTKYGIRPFVMFVQDKALAFLCVYAGISYALLYTILVALPLTFSSYRHFHYVPTYLPSIGVLIGVCFTTIYISVINSSYVKAANKAQTIWLPDERLKPMMTAAILLPIGLFIFAWTAPFTNVHWIAPIIGAVIVGFSTSTIFIASIMYMIEAYKQFAASAFSINAVLRSTIAILFLLVLSRMIEAMTIQGAFSFFGGLSILIAPGPFILFKYGKRWRESSKWA